MTIAGSDCSSGAGIQADLKTFQHFRVHGLSAVTCVVSETANVVRAVHPVPAEVITDQASLLLEAFPVKALKTGMLFSAETVVAIADIIEKHPESSLVVDPVMIASTGTPLVKTDAIEAYRALLLPLATLITPNLHEAEVLLQRPITNEGDLDNAARDLAITFNTAVLLKGGHLEGNECIDLLVASGETFRFSAPRIDLPGSHGTGCTLSAAITAGLAIGKPLPEAVAMAKDYLGRTLSQSYSFPSPMGGTVHALNQGTSFSS